MLYLNVVLHAVCCLKHFGPYLHYYCMELTQIWIGRKPSFGRSIYGVRVRVTRPNSDEIGRLNLAQLKLILSGNRKQEAKGACQVAASRF